MEKEDILRKSREENEGLQDERERAAVAQAGKAGMRVGALVCLLLVIVGRTVLPIPEISMGALTVYFAMAGSSSLVLHNMLQNKKYLIYGIAELAIAALFVCVIFVKNLG